MRILITSGGTEEKIDQVRRITNVSSGQTGLYLAEQLASMGHTIYFVRALKAPSFSQATVEKTFETSDDLINAIQSILDTNLIDVVIQCAAVSDFSVDKLVINGEIFEPDSISKMDSRDQVEIILKSRPKIITQIKTMSQHSAPIVVGFKLTNTNELEDRLDQIFKLSKHPEVDFVVHNDLQEITEDSHPTHIYFKDKVLFEGQTKKDLAKNLNQVLENLKEAFHDIMS